MVYTVDFRSEIPRYPSWEFTEHLLATDVEPTEEILPDHPIWSFLNHLCGIVYYLPAFDSDPQPPQIRQAWFLISETLHWVQRHQEVGSANYTDSCENTLY
jgi:hypothetical protein